jgi:hypothetical protein
VAGAFTRRQCNPGRFVTHFQPQLCRQRRLGAYLLIRILPPAPTSSPDHADPRAGQLGALIPTGTVYITNTIFADHTTDILASTVVGEMRTTTCSTMDHILLALSMKGAQLH